MTRPTLWIAVCFAMLSAAAVAGEITICRDRWGVPSILADNEPDALYGLGYAMAQDNAVMMARTYKLARGRLAEVDGRGALATDLLLRAIGFEQLAEAKAADWRGAVAEAAEAFVAGANRALAERRATLPLWIEPFSTVDVLALAQFINAAFPLLRLQRELTGDEGSNQFAIAPARAAGGHAILSIDPHLDWDGPIVWYEYALYTPEFDCRGCTCVGLPASGMGHTRTVAWSNTNNDPDLYDLYRVEINPANPRQYNYHGEWRDFEETPIELGYLVDGRLVTTRATVRRTAWGPMLPSRPYALRLSMLGSWEVVEQDPLFRRAKNVFELRAALRLLGRSMWNFVMADTSGNIAYQYNARVPHRAAGIDWTRPVNGADPATAWGAWWDIDELPHCENPRSGLLVNANSAPWLTPLGPEIPATGWPREITTYGHTCRYDRLAELLAADPSVTVEEAQRYATDIVVPYARATGAALRTAAGPAVAGERRLAVQLLADWDGRADLGSRACGLYLYWLQAAPEAPSLAMKAGAGWSPDDAAQALNLLDRAVAAILEQHGRLDVPWGDIHYAQRGEKRVPMPGFPYVRGPDGGAITTVAPVSGVFENGAMVCTRGSSFRMVVELDPAGVRSWSALPYGNSHDPANPHCADQTELFGRLEYKYTRFGATHAREDAVTTTILSR